MIDANSLTQSGVLTVVDLDRGRAPDLPTGGTADTDNVPLVADELDPGTIMAGQDMTQAVEDTVEVSTVGVAAVRAAVVADVVTTVEADTVADVVARMDPMHDVAAEATLAQVPGALAPGPPVVEGHAATDPVRLAVPFRRLKRGQGMGGKLALSLAADRPRNHEVVCQRISVTILRKMANAPTGISAASRTERAIPDQCSLLHLPNKRKPTLKKQHPKLVGHVVDPTLVGLVEVVVTVAQMYPKHGTMNLRE